MPQQFLQAEYIPTTQYPFFGEGMTEQVDRRFVYASFVVVCCDSGLHAVARELLAELIAEQEVLRFPPPISKVLLQDFSHGLR